MRGPVEREPAPPGDAGPPANGRPTVLRLAAISFASWLVALVALALTSANPVTLNRQQILRSEVVVEAVVANVTAGECRVIQSWPEGAVGETVRVVGLDLLPIETGEAYMLPLASADDRTYQIVLTAPPASVALIYPATDAARNQLEVLLAR